MKVSYTPHFRRNFQKFSKGIQTKFVKQIDYLLDNIQHPSLDVKKYDKSRQIWQARVDKNVRFYFSIEKDIYTLLDIKTHPK